MYISVHSAQNENCDVLFIYLQYTTYVQYSTPLKKPYTLLANHVMFEQGANLQSE